MYLVESTIPEFNSIKMKGIINFKSMKFVPIFTPFMDLEDLSQEAWFVYNLCVKNYLPEKEVKFTSFFAMKFSFFLIDLGRRRQLTNYPKGIAVFG